MTQTPTVQITYRVNCGGDITVSIGPLQLNFQPDALAEFLRLGAEALDEVEARYTAIRELAE
ncbi:hypothetical protein [Actinophytocola sediminis]